MLPYLVLTALVALFYIAVQRRTAFLSVRQWKRLGSPSSTAAYPEADKSLYGQVIRRGPAAIQARKQ
jgi:hypothetical protein